jgi:hypothetical protein
MKIVNAVGRCHTTMFFKGSDAQLGKEFFKIEYWTLYS